jgi:hypothetical protein
LEVKQNEQIKVRIENLFNELKKSKTDFLGIRNIFKSAHPYKYRELKENWIEQILNAKITVQVDSVIRRSYDVN